MLDLNKYLDKAVRVKFQGGREGKALWPCVRQERDSIRLQRWHGLGGCAQIISPFSHDS